MAPSLKKVVPPLKKVVPRGATFSLHLQTIQQSLDKVVPPDTSMVCGADKVLTWLRIVLININIRLVDFLYLLLLFMADCLDTW